MKDIEAEVLEFVRHELSCKVDVDSSLNICEHATVAEDIYDMMDKYSAIFNIDCSQIHWRRYFPQKVLPFLPNAVLPTRLKSDRHKPDSFTVSMLIDSAKAGRWLY
ncbi:TPA: DUF1493 family protein [Serratia odorifera]